MLRRYFLKSSTVGILAPAIPSWLNRLSDTGISHLYSGLKSNRYLGKIRIETIINDQEIFTEGPAADSEGNIYFTNVAAQKILKWNVKPKSLSVFFTNSNKTNGLRFAAKNKLLACEGEGNTVTLLDINTRTKTAIAHLYNGKEIQSPNDVEIDRYGRIYFSSRSDKVDPSTQNVRSVYRVDPDGKIIQLLSEPEIHMPNGIALSPDEKILYVIEAHPDKDQNRCILAFDVAEDGSISNRRTLIDFYPGRSGDGMAIDREGNLYVAAGLHKRRNTSETLDTRPGIHVISPAGKLLAFRETPIDTVTNCTFGGPRLKTLYITCGKYLLSMSTKVPGKDSYRPSAI